MDKQLKDVITKIYINKEINTAMTPERSIKLGDNIRESLSRIADMSVEVEFPNDQEANDYQNIKHCQTCAVAMDIIASYKYCRKEMVIQISKLGPFARVYWRKKTFLFGTFYFGTSYYSEIPKKFPLSITSSLTKILNDCGITTLSSKQLIEEFQGIKSCINDDNSSIGELLFCWDGYH